MRARRLHDVRQLVESEAFRLWWSRLDAARRALAEAVTRSEGLEETALLAEARAELSQARATALFYRAGDHDSRAAELHAQSEALENQAFPEVAAFEEQRFLVSELWYRLGAAENVAEQAPTERKLELERARLRLQAEYAREEARRNQLWEEVERSWEESCDVGLRASEQRQFAQHMRREAERGFAASERDQAAARAARDEHARARTEEELKRAAVAEVRRLAGARFGCVVGTDFLFFRHPGDSLHAYAVGLVEDLVHYNIEVRPLGVYLVDRARGVGFLEPARVPMFDAEGDKRFEEYFLVGRRGQPRAPGN